MLELIAGCTDDQGISLNELVTKLKPKFNEAAIKSVAGRRGETRAFVDVGPNHSCLSLFFFSHATLFPSLSL